LSLLCSRIVLVKVKKMDYFIKRKVKNKRAGD